MFSVFSKGIKLHCVSMLHLEFMITALTQIIHVNKIIGITTGSIMANFMPAVRYSSAAEVRFTYPMSCFYL